VVFQTVFTFDTENVIRVLRIVRPGDGDQINLCIADNISFFSVITNSYPLYIQI
jgi:hypothetical protein